jgi:hypothetical protein
MEIKLNDLIQVHDDVIPENFCNTLIQFFEDNVDLHERIEHNSAPNFTQLNLTDNLNKSSELETIHNFLISKVFEYKKKYYKMVDKRCFPSDHSFEKFRIKKYFCELNDQFDTHVDVKDYSTARRFLSFFWYLNDVTEGGETIFKDLEITPKRGKMVIFPPLWMYPHKGCIPKSNDKYLLSTYLHFK